MASEPVETDGPSAYDLLSKPTLELSNAEVQKLVEDLRRRRKLYIATGKADRPGKPKAPAAPKTKATADDKRRNTEQLLAGIDWKMPS